MNTYLAIKTIHVISASILFGTGIGTAFFMLRAYLSGNREALIVTTRNVVIADWLFTTPAVFVQIITGFWLTSLLKIAYGSLWFISVMSLFVFVGACWIPVVGIQIRMRAALSRGVEIGELAPLMRVWVALGVPAFLSMILLYLLMVSKHGVTTMLFA